MDLLTGVRGGTLTDLFGFCARSAAPTKQNPGSQLLTSGVGIYSGTLWVTGDGGHTAAATVTYRPLGSAVVPA
jgi:hypothetical protein